MRNLPHNLRRVKVVAAMKKTIDMETQKCYKTNRQCQNHLQRQVNKIEEQAKPKLSFHLKHKVQAEREKDIV